MSVSVLKRSKSSFSTLHPARIWSPASGGMTPRVACASDQVSGSSSIIAEHALPDTLTSKGDLCFDTARDVCGIR